MSVPLDVVVDIGIENLYLCIVDVIALRLVCRSWHALIRRSVDVCRDFPLERVLLAEIRSHVWRNSLEYICESIDFDEGVKQYLTTLERVSESNRSVVLSAAITGSLAVSMIWGECFIANDVDMVALPTRFDSDETLWPPYDAYQQMESIRDHYEQHVPYRNLKEGDVRTYYPSYTARLEVISTLRQLASKDYNVSDYVVGAFDLDICCSLIHRRHDGKRWHWRWWTPLNAGQLVDRTMRSLRDTTARRRQKYERRGFTLEQLV